MSHDQRHAKATIEALRTAMSRTTATSPTFQEGRRLATIRRGRDGEMRLTFEENQGHPYLRLRLWAWTDWGLSPTKKALTIRAKELPLLLEGLLAAADELRARLELEVGE